MILAWVLWAAMIGSILTIIIAGVRVAYARCGDHVSAWPIVAAIAVGTTSGVASMVVV